MLVVKCNKCGLINEFRGVKTAKENGWNKYGDLWTCPTCKDYKQYTVNLPTVLVDFIDNNLNILYASRSAAMRTYIIRGLKEDIQTIKTLRNITQNNKHPPKLQDLMDDTSTW